MIVILHNIRSLHNVGSIFRTADAVGAEKMYLTGITPAPLDRFGKPRPQLTKVSLGAEKSMPWEHQKSIGTVIKKLKNEGYKIFAVEQSKKAVPYTSVKGHTRIVLIMGNEVKGLPASILKRADKVIEIPMHGKKESLNVAVAFGVVAFGLRYG